MRRLSLTIIVVGILVALGLPAAQGTTMPSLTIPSGTEVIPYISYEGSSGFPSSINLYDPATRKSETIGSTEGTDSFLWQPQLSEDGKKILFLDFHNFGPNGETEERQESIGFIPSDGGERSRIVTGEEISGYDLSQDGSKILYQTYDASDQRFHLFTAPVESNASPTEVPVPSNFLDVHDPIFNKDGTGIFFTSRDQSDASLTAYQVYYMNLDGTGVTKLTDFVYNPDAGATQPAGHFPLGKELSPDGNTIVYYGGANTGNPNCDTGIYTLPVSGGTPREVAVPPLSPCEGSLTVPHYNHDGSKIMYSQGFDLYSVSAADGGNKQLLVRGNRGGLGESGNWEVVNYASPAPIVTSVTPADGEPDVSQTTRPTATFDQDLDQATVNSKNVKFEVYNPTKAKWAPVQTMAPTYDQNTKTITVNPSNLLGSQKTYRVTLSTGIKSSTGKPLASPYSWTFTTA